VMAGNFAYWAIDVPMVTISPTPAARARSSTSGSSIGVK